MKSKSSNAREHYQREKARRARTARPESELIAAAKREYLALLEAEAAKGKGGRPKKKAAKRAAPRDELDHEADHDGDHGDDALDESESGSEDSGEE